MSEKEGYDSDAPEEFTQEQTIAKHDEISKAQKDSEARAIREKKEQRKQREKKEQRKQHAKRITPQSSTRSKNIEDVEELEENPEAEQYRMNQGFLPKHVVEQLAAREKSEQASPSDSEDDDNEEAKSLTIEKKKKRKSLGTKSVIIEEMPPPECLKNSLEFLKKRKMQVARSSSVLNNSNQALRLVSGMLTNRQ